MVRSGVCFHCLLLSSAVILISVNAVTQSKPEKERIRIGYAARAVTHAIPFLANEADLFREERLQVEVMRNDRCRFADGSHLRRYRFCYDVGLLANSGVRSEPEGGHARRVDPVCCDDAGKSSGNPHCQGFDGRSYRFAASRGCLREKRPVGAPTLEIEPG